MWVRRSVVLLAMACNDPGLDAARAAVVALPSDARCPPGMVLVEGAGTLGMRAERFAVVSTAGRAEVVDPQAECPAALAAHGEAVACWVQTDLVDPVVPPRAVRVAPVCVDAFPFPGEGATYTEDGMTAWDAKVLHDVLARGDLGGRRLCTATELEAAVAGLPANQPVVYGDRHDPDRCPEGARIGQDPTCANRATGLHEYAAVHSHWVVADPAFVASACAQPPCKAAGNRPLQAGMFLVLGGTGRLQTRQAPLTPHTWHDHGRPTPTGRAVMRWATTTSRPSAPTPTRAGPLRMPHSSRVRRAGRRWWMWRARPAGWTGCWMRRWADGRARSSRHRGRFGLGRVRLAGSTP